MADAVSYPLWLNGADAIVGRKAVTSVVAQPSTMLIGFFLVGLLEHRNRTIFRMGIDSAAVLAVFALGATALSQVPAEPQQEGTRERKGSAK